MRFDMRSCSTLRMGAEELSRQASDVRASPGGKSDASTFLVCTLWWGYVGIGNPQSLGSLVYRIVLISKV